MARVARISCICLAALTGSAVCRSKDNVLAAVGEGNLPSGTQPSSAFTLVPRMVTHPGGEAGEARPQDFFDPEVEKWMDAGESDSFPHTRSRGWRLVVDMPEGVDSWCVKRLKFEITGAHEELQDVGINCRTIAPGAALMTDPFHPGNAFHDDASDGCSLREQHTRLFYIGVRCDDVHEVNQIEVVQMDVHTMASNGRVQQLRAGHWIDVGETVPLPFNWTKVVFQAASCHEDVCTHEFIPKHTSELPKTCPEATCPRHLCCDQKDICSKRTCTTPGWALKMNASGTRCATEKCREEFCCEKKAVCLSHVCAINKQSLKPSPPALCRGPTCLPTECCDVPVCVESVCEERDQSVLKATLPARCASVQCTFDECCKLPDFSDDSADCEEDVCTSANLQFDDTKFGQTCNASPCLPSECCIPGPPPVPSPSHSPRLWSVPAGLARREADAGRAGFVATLAAGCVGVVALLSAVLVVVVRTRGSPVLRGADEVEQLMSSE